MRAKDIISEVMRPGPGKRDIENIPVGFGSGGSGGVGGGMPIPLNPAGQNVWRSGQTGAPMRSPGDKAQNIDDVVLQQLTKAGPGQRSSGPIPVPPAPGEKYVTPAALATTAAIGVPLFTAGGDKSSKSGQQPAATGTKSQYYGSAPARPAAATTPAPAARPAAAVTPAPATTTRPAAAATPRPAGGPQQGVVGSQLAQFSGGEFANRADRLNQAKVDQILGKGKFTAGTAAANTALLGYFKDAAIRQELERRQPPVSNATVSPAGGVKPTETLPRVEIPASDGSSSGGTSSASPAASSSGGSSDNTVKSGTGLTWTDSSGNPVKFGVDETALQRLMTLSGQRH